MKHAKLLSLIILFALIAPAFAGKKPKGRGKPPPKQQQAEQPASARLSQFSAAHLDHILSPLDRQVALPRTKLNQLRESFVDQWSKAPEVEKPQYQTAVAVCDALSSAMDEREKAIASLQGSAAVHGPTDLGAHRKDNPTKRDIKRERHEERNRKQKAAQTDTFFNTQLKTNWTQRTLQLRRRINLLSSRQRDVERAAEQAKAASPSPTRPTTTPQ